jgi:transposase InsO family protein
MNVHKNARLTPNGRIHLIELINRAGLKAAAAATGLSLRTAAKWRDREACEGVAGLVDHSSRPRRLRAPITEAKRERIVRLRQRRCTMRTIAVRVGVSMATVSRVLADAGCSRLPALDPSPPVRRYEHAAPGDLLHLDTKKLGRIVRPGHRVTGDPRDSVDGAGWEVTHVAIDDHSRVAFAQVLHDESKHSAVAFLRTVVACYAVLGVTIRRLLTDNGSAYRSKLFAQTCQTMGIKHSFTRPYTPRTNGKAERFIQTILREWAYVRSYRNSAHRTRALQPWLSHYNLRRTHSALGHRPPISRIGMNNLLQLNN